MTWQSIDENTYIDDTLVTCAEYQLFIDEMREQGKYYQPDHWTSFQFPSGQARKPILGVRYSDAKEFCEWLTESKASNWLFRLPTSGDVNRFPLINNRELYIGFWTARSLFSSQGEMVWIGSPPVNPRNINYLTLTQNAVLASDLACYCEFIDALDLVRDYETIYDFGNPSFVGAEDFSPDLDLIIERSFEVDRSGKLDGLIKIAYTLACNHTKNLDLALALVLDYGRGGAYIRSMETSSLLDGNRTTRNAISFARILGRGFARGLVKPDRIYTLTKLYLDFYTLRERIAGRSPAFEGIRLVKERIK